MADSGNNDDDVLPPLPRGTYNFNFDELDENTNPFQSSSKIAQSPLPARKNQPGIGPDGDSPFQSKSKLARSPPSTPTPNAEATPQSGMAADDVSAEDNSNPDHNRNSLQHSPPLPRKAAYEIVENIVDDSQEVDSPPRSNAVSDPPSQPPAKAAQPRKKKPMSTQKSKTNKKSNRLSKEVKDDVVPSESPSAVSVDQTTCNTAAGTTSPTLTKSAENPPSPVINPQSSSSVSPESAVTGTNSIGESTSVNDNKNTDNTCTQSVKINNTQPVPEPGVEPEPEQPNPTKKKQARIKKPVKPLKLNKGPEAEIEIFAPPPKSKESQEKLAAQSSEVSKPTSLIGEAENQGKQSELVEQEGPSQDWSQTDDGMGESVQDDFPGDFPADERTGGSPEGEFVDCQESSFHEFGMGDDQGLGDMGDEPNEEFVPASEVFTDPDAWEMLEKLGGQGNFKDTDLARQSLYVKFDPLHQVEDQMKGKSKEKSVEPASPGRQGDDLMQMNTPPVKKGTPKQHKHPAVKRLEQQVSGKEDVGGARQVDQIYSMSPSAGEKDIDESEVHVRRQFSIPEVPPVMGDSWFDQVNTFKEMEDSTMSQDSVDVFTGWTSAQDYHDGDPLRYEDRETRSSSQELDQDADSGHAGSACTASPPKSGPGGEDDLVEMLKYTQNDINKLRRDLEMDFQGRLLIKERDWSKKLAEKEKDTSNFRDQVEKLKAAHEDMKCIVSEYEKTISQLVAEKEKSSSDSKDSLGEIIKDRDQAVEDLRSVESAFSDLHRRYEKIKTVVDGFKKNEEILKKSVQDYQGKLKEAEQRYQALKNQAEEKLDLANLEIDKVRKITSSEVARLEAAVRKKDLQVKSLEKTLDTKVKENEELTSICDELIAKVGTGQ